MFFRPFILMLALMICALPASAEEKQQVLLPLWEVGAGAGLTSLPQYMGSDERYTFGIAFPYLIYRGNRLRVDRDGIDRKLFGIEGLALNLSLGFGLPVRNSNRARAGMPKLHTNGQLGPRLDWRFADDDHSSWTLRLPVRAVIDTTGHSLGWLADPDVLIKLHHLDRDNRLEIRIQGGLLYGSKRYHDTYYSVDAPYVTANRPAYQARAGLHSLALRTTLSYRFTPEISLFTSVRLRDMKVGVVRDSPLVKQPWYLSGIIGVTWSFWQSERMMPAD